MVMNSKKSKRALFAWEMGGGLGHMASLIPVAESLAEHGIEPVFALQDLSRVESLLGGRDVRYVQAPLWLRLSGASKSEQSMNYAELLGKLGYRDRTGLKGLVKAWTELYKLIDPDLLVVDHAPTAQLAARDMPFRKAQIGNSFTVPPIESPMPPFLRRHAVETEKLLRSEGQVLECINYVLDDLGRERLPNLGALFASDKAMIGTFEELDVFERKAPSAIEYVGSIFTSKFGSKVDWPASGTTRVFVYVHSAYWNVDALLSSLIESDYRIIAYVAGLDDASLKKYQSRAARVVNRPVDIDDVLSECDLVVCHGGIGTVAQSLLSGRPVLLLPRQLEQYMCALTVTKAGMGYCLDPFVKQVDYARLIREIMESDKYAINARKFAERYKDFRSNEQLQKLGIVLRDLANDA